MSHTYRINDARAISEQLDGETIILNLEAGNYYSTNKTGARIWELIGEEVPVSQIVDHFIDSFDAPPDTLEQSVRTIIDFLASEGLIIEAAERSNKTLLNTSTTRQPFVIPTIEKYEDMQEMLLADPIHDVDQTGWPKLKTDQ